MKDTMLLFDLDGTLWDSAKEIADSWSIILKKHFPEMPALTPDDLHAVMGKTMDEIARTVAPNLTQQEIARVFPECEEFELAYIAEHGGVLFSGVRETLEQLKEEGFSMAIVSNCQAGYIQAFFQSMGLGDFFCDFEEWGRTKRSKADNIRLVMERNGFQKGIYIGDTDKDEAAAGSAGIPFIHAAYGFGNVKHADGVIRSFSELPSLLKTIL